MTVFLVPDDFPLVSLAVASPLVQKGDVILVKNGVENEVVVVPPDKAGLRIVADRGDGFIPDEGSTEVVEDTVDQGLEAGENDGAENEVGDSNLGGADLSGNPADGISGDVPDQDSGETGAEEVQELSGSPDDSAQPLEEVAADSDLETGPQPFIIVTKAGGKMVRLGQASGSPYWVVVHRHG